MALLASTQPTRAAQMGQFGARTIKIKCTHLADGALPSEAQA
jgi:hypothetical protein